MKSITIYTSYICIKSHYIYTGSNKIYISVGRIISFYYFVHLASKYHKHYKPITQNVLDIILAIIIDNL